MRIEKDPFDRHFDSFISLADAICEALQCPVTIENANHQLIAYSSHSPHTDPARIATIIGRRVPEQVIGALWRNGVIQKLMSSDEPVRIGAVHDVGLGQRIAIAIRKHNEVLGYIWVMEEADRGPLNELELELLKRAALASRHKMLQLQIQKRKEEEGQQNLFWQLLTGHLKSPAAIKEQAEQLNISLPPRYQVTVFQFGQDITEKMYQRIQYMITTTQRVKVILHVLDGARLIMLTAHPKLAADREDHARFIRDFMRQMEDRFGVSPNDGASGSEYDDYTLVAAAWREALAVLQLKQRFPEALRDASAYEELGLYRYLLLQLSDKEPPRRLQNRILHKLRQYDREHNGCLLDTLEVFLNLDSSLKDTAEALHVHINTLNYRLKRIAEIGDVDLKNVDQKVSLYLDLKLEKLMEPSC
ncbi:PucR family transcriptional regulator [Paenibacillus sp. H1-7]|uniref:PucR family transcriptional regulator n=1 Tax=Paenibacillus sp. H1-7 TaxID=2282849 RepID=UPI001EF99D2E|nr:helix-turn-helix domain-containing protein [Paenibacillus sp. H1-7]ULL15393.1 PucR family transcriptional regulator [Paenibacillus sp. H1-7]